MSTDTDDLSADYDNGTAEFEESWKFHEDHIFPLLTSPHQQVFLLTVLHPRLS